MNYMHTHLSLQQGFVHQGREDVSNDIVAFYDRHNSILIIRPEIIVSEIEKIEDFLFDKIKQRFDTVMRGEGFSVDTWDEKIKKHSIIKHHEQVRAN